MYKKTHLRTEKHYLKFISGFDREKLSALVLKPNQVTSTWASIMAWYWAINTFLKVLYEDTYVLANQHNKAQALLIDCNSADFALLVKARFPVKTGFLTRS